MNGACSRLMASTQRPLAVDAADSGASTTIRSPGLGVVVGVDLVQFENRALVRIARVFATYTRRVGDHRAHLLLDHFGALPQPDRVVVGLRHLAPVDTGYLRRLGQERLRFGQDDAPAALKIPEQAFAIADGEVLLFSQQRLGSRKCLGVAAFEIVLAGLSVQAGRLLAHLGDRPLGVRLELRFPTEDVVEAPGDLARQFQVRDLVAAHRHVAGAVHQDVGSLQHGIAQEPIGAEIPVAEIRQLILVGRHAFEPGNRRDHR